MPEAAKYKTINSASEAEFRDRGSRFLAFAYPVQTLEQVKTFIKNLKAQHPKAVHHCVAYRLGPHGLQFRASDDGEPSGSAGRPMLGAIDSAGITNVLVVVVRYFGGTLLGVPGLINAYGTASAAAIAAAEVSEHWVEKLFDIECDYANLGEVLYLLRKAEARILKQDLQLFCLVKATIPEVFSENFTTQVSEIRGVKIKSETSG